MDDRFNTFLSGCNSQLPKAFKKKDVPLVPKEIRDSLSGHLNKSYEEMHGKKLLELFDTVYLFSGGKYIPYPESLSYSNVVGVDRVANINRDNVILTNDCLTTISAGMNASTKLDFGFLKNENAIKLEMLSDRRNGLSIVYGTFASPLFSENPTPAQSVFKASKIWSWYESHPDRIGQSNYVWSQLHGIAGYELTNMMWATKYDAKAAAGGGGGIGPLRIDVSGDGTATFENTKALVANLYRVIAFGTSDGGAAGYSRVPANLPQLTQAATDLNTLTARLISNGGNLPEIVSDQPFLITFVLDGLTLCDNRWELVNGSAFTLDGAPKWAISETGEPSCQFVAEYSPPAFSESTVRHQLSVPLKRTFNSIVNGSPITHSFVTQAKLGKSSEGRGFPQLRLFASTASPPVGGNFAIRGNWAVTIGALKVTDYQASQPFEYSCGPDGPSGAAVTSDSVQRPLPSDGIVPLTFILGGMSAAPTVAATCRIEGQITLRLLDGSVRNRAIEPLVFTLAVAAPVPVTSPVG
ncbi:hypothetical protein O6027_03295 [Sphingomonas aerolata]|uniref:hypothetical protein n=1 Tax=Sphingomonas aerolata TaxID=185951 RepID=UPI003360A39B